MPEFSTPFAGQAAGRKLTKPELIRAIRYSIAAEYEATQLYMQLAESTDDRLTIEVLTDIADEERVHAGEFLRLLNYLDPEEPKLYAEGSEEVEKMMEKISRKSGAEPDPREKNNPGDDLDLPYCRTAPAAEQARAYNEDEPCDDARAGKEE